MERLVNLAMNSEGYAFDPMTGECFQINENGKLIINLILKGMSLKEIATRLCADQTVGFSDAYTDTFEFISNLQLFGLVNLQEVGR